MASDNFQRPPNLSPLTLARLLRRRSQREIARALGISRAVMSRIESGERVPSYALMRKISAELGVEIDDLFPEDEGKQLREDLRSQLGMKKRRRRKR